MVIEYVSGGPQNSVPIQLSLLHATQALNQELWSGVLFRLTAELLWSSLEAHTAQRGLHLPGNVDDLAQQLEQIRQEIPQETIRMLYHFMPRRVAACIQARGGSTLY
ncbi:hypothetical protein TNCV_3195181 [Trichonephila clavipes]|uniref:Uncharacterized protein n=1 Tax=Trichonephila clavipes TaxID=2585209 RepID=A0A8X6RAU3_TRICX|nr:hypothetical protein TNCV_3195181 [Trichonephila clavipes]